MQADDADKGAFDPKADDDQIIRQAKRRFKRCEEWESKARDLFRDDYRFANADCDNGYQWPDDIKRNRDIDNKPCLTINKTRQHNLQIINDAKQNKPGITFRPVGNDATYEAAEAFEGIARHIEYISNATDAYDTATEFQVQAGWGYWRIVTDYIQDVEDETAFDQEIYIRRIKDPLTVYLDPDISEVDGSDAKFGFVYDDITREQFEADYPDYADDTSAPFDNSESWINKDHVRIAEYYRVVYVKDILFTLTDEQGNRTVSRKSKIPADLYRVAKKDQSFQSRELTEPHVEWYKIVGDKIVDRRPWPGKYIPIVRLIGEETVIDGTVDRKGHTRAIKDPQRMYNYWNSAAVEQVALQTNIPWLTPVEAIEGYETYWASANRVPHAYLPYNALRDDGASIPPPERVNPPVMASAMLQGMQTAAQDMQYVSGQYEAEMGAPSNEVSGKAINERQRQGDRATYHFIDNLGVAIRFTGRIILDLIPKIYDTPRTMRILGEDGSENYVQVDPAAKQAYQAAQAQQSQKVSAIFNPNVGKYDVIADTGPSYATRRQEAFNAFSQIIAQNADLVHIVGDLLFKSADFPGADEIAERLRRMVPAQALGTAPPPELAQMGQQLKSMQGILQKTLEELATEKMKSRSKDAQKDINVYEATTDRMKVMGELQSNMHDRFISPRDIAMMVADMMKQEHAASLQPVLSTEAPELAEQASAGQTQPQGMPQ